VYFYFDLEMKESAKSPFPALDYFWRTNSMQKSCRSKFRFQFHCRPTKIKVKFKGRGLDSSWSCLDRESQSRQYQKACLDFVSTPPYKPKSLDRDQEINQDMTFLVNLDSCLNRNREWVYFVIFLDQDFSNRQDFWTLKNVLINLKKSWIILIVLKSLDCLDLFR
jgi:hypothetical protein